MQTSSTLKSSVFDKDLYLTKMEPKVTNSKGLKTYSRRKSTKCVDVLNKETKNEPLTTKEAVKFLLQGSLRWRVCRFCLTSTTSLSELDEILEVASSGAIFQVTIRDMLASFYPFQMVDDPNFPNKMCNKCLDKTINSYLFTQQCERSERALRNCFEDINEKFDKLDPLERVKRRGRQKQNPNRNVLYVDNKRVISYAEPIINLVNIGASNDSENTTGINEFECPKCWQVLPNLESFVNHEKVHPKSMWYNCRLCGKSFVKQSQHKKHLKQCHLRSYVSGQADGDSAHFKCNECGRLTREYDEHLQHVEKHKFRNILERLVERKMDDLCGVCMDKGPRMVELNETFHIHGGYPELTGEKTLAAILSATIPEKSYKYKESHLAKQASVIKITKERSNSFASLKKTNDDCDMNESPRELSMPAYRAPVNCFFHIDDGTNPFEFSKPLSLIDDLQVGDHVNNGSRHEFKHDQSCTTSKQGCSNEMENICDLNMRAFYAQLGVVGKPAQCNICWIFKKAQCDICVKDIKVNDAEPQVKIADKQNAKTKECNNCWLFSKLGRCDHCKKELRERNENIRDTIEHKAEENDELKEIVPMK